MKQTLILVLIALVAAAGAFAQSDLQPVAIVQLTKSEPITVKQLKDEARIILWQSFVQQYNRPPEPDEINKALSGLKPDERRQALEQMINEKLALQAAERDRISVTDSEVSQQLEQARAMSAQSINRQPTDAEFAEAIRTNYGLGVPAFREYLKRQLIVQKYILAKKQTELENINVSPEEIQREYDKNLDKFFQPDMVRISMIQVPFTDAASKAKARAAADRLVRQIGTNSTKFDDMVTAYVKLEDKTKSDYAAGDFGYLPLNAEGEKGVGVAFYERARSLQIGEVSGLIETSQSFCIIQIKEKLLHKLMSLGDVFPGSAMTVRQYIGNTLLQQKQQAALVKVTEDLIAELRKGNPFQILEANLNW